MNIVVRQNNGIEKVFQILAAVQQAMNGYDPSVIGYAWDDTNPRIQLEPRFVLDRYENENVKM